MNQSILYTLNKAGIELNPGQIILFQPRDVPGDRDFGRRLEDFINSRFMKNTHGLRFQLIEMSAPIPELTGKMVARRFNIGSLNKYHILVGDDIVKVVHVLADISSLDDRPLVDISKKHSDTTGTRKNAHPDIYPSNIFPSCSSLSMVDFPMDVPIEEDTPKPSIYDEMECCNPIVSDEDEDWVGFEEVHDVKGDLSEPDVKLSRSIFFAGKPSDRQKKMRPSKETKPHVEDLTDEREADKAEKAKEELVKRLTAVIVDYVNTTHQMPPMEEIYQLVKGKIVLTPTGLSRLVVNDQLKVYLPDYNELEVTFRPLPLTIYILFLRHLEGIVLNYISDYGRELEEIYSIVMPNRDEKNARKSLKNITDTLSGSLNQKLAIIKRTFKANILNQEMAAKYYISGSRGEAYKVSLPKNLIQLPAIFN